MDPLFPPLRPRRLLRTTAWLLAVTVLCTVPAGCGGGSTPTGASTPARTTSSKTSSPSPRVSSTAGTTTTTTTTTPATPGAGKPAVTIGDKNFGEQFVLGQLYLLALRAQGFTVSINQDIGPTSVVLGSLKNHHLAMYPEYLNVINETYAHRRHPPKTLPDAYRSAHAWAVSHGLELLKPTPFSDTTGIAVTDVYARQHHLHTLDDLFGVTGTLVIGGALQFETSRSGVHALENTYGVAFSKFAPLAVGSQYAALDDDTVQAAFVTTTDGELATGDYRVLGDPQNIFGYGNVVPIVTRQAAKEEGPAFTATIERVDRTLTLSAIRQLNNAVDVAKLSPATVADQFLQTHGLLEPLTSIDYY